MKPLVSVIIPYYNRPQMLLRAVRSVMAQDYPNIEVIVVDDASTEAPQQLEEFESVILLQNKQNSGPGACRNTGMQSASGDYFAFLDCDDYWAPTFISACMSVFKISSKNTIFVYANSYLVNKEETTGLRYGKIVATTTIIPDIFVSGRPWCTSACLWNRKLLGDQQWLSTRNWEDYAFDTEAAVKSNQIGFVSEPLVYYEEGGSDKLSVQMSSKTEQEKAASVLHISKNLRNSPFGNQGFIKNKMQQLLLARIIYELKNGADNIQQTPLFTEYLHYPKQFKTSFIRILLKTNRKGAIKFLEKQKRYNRKKAAQFLQ